MKFLSINDCLKNNQFSYYFINKTSSTMDYAKLLIDSTNNNLFILAEEQTKGRGRRGNSWNSPKGNIYCSFVLNIKTKEKNFFNFSILTLVSVKNALKYIGLSNISFKWPNDIFILNKKICGVLQEVYTSKMNIKKIIIGIGINFISSPNVDSYETTYIKKYIKDINIQKFIQIFVNYFLYYYNDYYLNNNINFINDYKKKQMYLNDCIKIKNDNNKILQGKFIGINNDGSLLLNIDEKLLSIYSGQILL